MPKTAVAANAHAVLRNREPVQAKRTPRPFRQVSPYDLTGTRARGLAASVVESAGWVRRFVRG
ncbi:hypothetical protein EDD52_12416 [Primorskyibacter sedentarius]|uniref:Uncharacterized protein n=1 Tax=Primorskyibacter sedentarius TaxID=745311 RepID=A0A4R3J2B3_9RHOB|nr:hypothetical protein EDD52_12416 [Primorskyibacter sedentarius]